MGKLDLKKTKKPFVLFQTVISVFIFFLKCLSLIDILRIVDKKYYILVCLPIQNQKYVIL